ncbi:MAG TPA: SDR family oxidoreductase [Bryobacteraceae bacterium]|nr:SDR family oxidoreductase [Bryobacteraceae bacterium]
MSSLSGREIILAGGTGGLGQASAESLAAEGASLVLSYRSNEQRAREYARLGKLLRADLSEPDDRSALLDAAPQMYGLVVFSGEAVRVKDPAEVEAAIKRSTATNFIGPIMLAREAAERMKGSSVEGSLVIVSTMQATALFEGSTAYAAPKAALVHAGQVLAKECRGKANIRVNVVCPGANYAGMAESSIASGKYDRYLNADMIPRWGRADDVAKLVRYLLEPDNYITGQVITIDGGLTL